MNKKLISLDWDRLIGGTIGGIIVIGLAVIMAATRLENLMTTVAAEVILIGAVVGLVGAAASQESGIEVLGFGIGATAIALVSGTPVSVACLALTLGSLPGIWLCPMRPVAIRFSSVHQVRS